MSAALDLAKKRLFDKENGMNVRNIKFFPGSSRDATPEQIAEQLNVVLSHIEAGDIDIEEITAE